MWLVELRSRLDEGGWLMFCKRIFDFVTQAEVVLAAPPCHNVRVAEREQPIRDIIRPNPVAADLIRRHEQLLLKLAVDKAA